MTAASEEEQLNRAAGWPIPLCRPFARRHVGGSRSHFIQLANRRSVRSSSVPYSTCEVLVEFPLPRCGIGWWGRCFAGRRGLGTRRSLSGSSHGVKLSAHQPPKIPSWARTAKSACGSKPCELIGPDPDLNTQPPRKTCWLHDAEIAQGPGWRPWWTTPLVCTFFSLDNPPFTPRLMTKSSMAHFTLIFIAEVGIPGLARVICSDECI